MCRKQAYLFAMVRCQHLCSLMSSLSDLIPVLVILSSIFVDPVCCCSSCCLLSDTIRWCGDSVVLLVQSTCHGSCVGLLFNWGCHPAVAVSCNCCCLAAAGFRASIGIRKLLWVASSAHRVMKGARQNLQECSHQTSCPNHI